MQRKIVNTKKVQSGACIQSRQKKLHSIPVLIRNSKYMKKSNVLYSIPCVKSCACSFCRATLFDTIKINVCIAILLISVCTLTNTLLNTNHTYATTETIGDSTASITLDTSDVEVTVEPGTKGYTSKDVTIKTSNAKDYQLTITAPATLSKENDTTSRADSWGYAYGQSGNLDAMTYTNFTGTAQTLATGTGDISNSKTLAIAADFTNSPSSGHYKAEVSLALTVTPKAAVTYTLTYNANGTNTSNLPSSQQCVAYDNAPCTITISNTIPTRTGYEFLGWAETSNATTAAYQAGSTITLSASKTLYGVWKAKIFSGITTMQDMTTEICNAASENETTQLTDTRDGKSYWVTKLKDGNCWMTQNLRIVGSRILTSSNSDVISDYTLNPSSITGFTDSGGVSLYYSGDSNTGTYYSWCAATAGTCTGTGVSDPNLEAEHSICPKGWQLPSKDNYEALIAVADLTVHTIQQIPYSFTYPIWYMQNSQLQNNSTYSYWWSKTAVSGRRGWNAYALRISTTDITMDSGTSYAARGVALPTNAEKGYAVRCIAN